MKNYAKVGGKKGKPGYRTPSKFIAKKSFNVSKIRQKGRHTGSSKV